MNSYVFLVLWQDRGTKDWAHVAVVAERAAVAVREHGGRLDSAFWTSGEYDVVVAAEFPDDAAADDYVTTLRSMYGRPTDSVTTRVLEAKGKVDVDRGTYG